MTGSTGKKHQGRQKPMLMGFVDGHGPIPAIPKPNCEGKLSEVLENEIISIYKLVQTIYSRKESEIFRSPVEWKAMELLDYPRYVHRPMDLGTVLSNLERGRYPNAEAVANDVRQVWRNCMIYNRDGSEYYHLANILAEEFEDAYSKLRKSFTSHLYLEPTIETGLQGKILNDEKNINEESLQMNDYCRIPSLENKAEILFYLSRLGQNELAYVLTRIEDDFPNALSINPVQHQVQINVDMLPPVLHQELYSFAMRCYQATSADHS